MICGVACECRDRQFASLVTPVESIWVKTWEKLPTTLADGSFVACYDHHFRYQRYRRRVDGITIVARVAIVG